MAFLKCTETKRDSSHVAELDWQQKFAFLHSLMPWSQPLVKWSLSRKDLEKAGQYEVSRQLSLYIYKAPPLEPTLITSGLAKWLQNGDLLGIWLLLWLLLLQSIDHLTLAWGAPVPGNFREYADSPREK